MTTAVASVASVTADTVIRLRPTAKDEFAGRPGSYKVIRGANGAINEFSYRGSRVFDLRFKRRGAGS